MIKRYVVTYFDDFTGRNIYIEYKARTAREAKKEALRDAGNVEIIDVRKVEEI